MEIDFVFSSPEAVAQLTNHILHQAMVHSCLDDTTQGINSLPLNCLDDTTGGTTGLPDKIASVEGNNNSQLHSPEGSMEKHLAQFTLGDSPTALTTWWPRLVNIRIITFWKTQKYKDCWGNLFWVYVSILIYIERMTILKRPHWKRKYSWVLFSLYGLDHISQWEKSLLGCNIFSNWLGPCSHDSRQYLENRPRPVLRMPDKSQETFSFIYSDQGYEHWFLYFWALSMALIVLLTRVTWSRNAAIIFS